MKVSLNWLRDYLGITCDTAALSNLLTFAGIEVEGIVEIGGDFPGVVAGRVTSYVQHPNADRLRLCQVDDGSGQPRQIVCGARNFSEGDCVPLALPGAVLPGDFKIKKGKLRGELSEGMLCSASELHLAGDADGLLLLDRSVAPGTPISDVLEKDTIIEIEVTPNRPDLLSHVGVARELACLTSRDLCEPNLPELPDEVPPIGVQIDALGDCPHYTATVIRGAQVGPSPPWLVKRLESIGLRPVNNIVDITNFVLMESGQPLHAFDRHKLDGSIIVRHAGPGEKFVALDGSRVALGPNHLVIADSAGPVALAGVMGGESTGITEKTSEIVLESAYFLPSSVRRTGRETGLSSDSSYRFERGVDPEGVIRAARRAVGLILEIAGGEVVGGMASEGKPLPPPPIIKLRGSFCAALLGIAISTPDITRILTSLGLKLTGIDGSVSYWGIPSFRRDLDREVDLVEEVIRVYGIENVPSRNRSRVFPASEADHNYDFALRMARHLVGAGFYECRTPSLVRESSLADNVFGPHSVLRITNPLGEDSAALRPSLVPGLIATTATNLRKGNSSLRIFEMGRVFSLGNPEEKSSIALACTGWVSQVQWQSPTPQPLDFFYLKGVIESIGIPGLTFKATQKEGLALCAEVLCGESLLGHIGQISPARSRAIDAPAPVVVAEIDFTTLRSAIPLCFRHRDLPRFPAVTRDIAMLLPLETPHARVVEVLCASKEPLLVDVRLFDLFTDPGGNKISADKKSVAYSLTYRSSERTLQQDEVHTAHNALKETLRKELGADFRE